MSERVLDVSQVARRLSVSRDTVRRMAERGAFPGAYTVGAGTRRYWKIPETALSDVRSVSELTEADRPR